MSLLFDKFGENRAWSVLLACALALSICQELNKSLENSRAGPGFAVVAGVLRVNSRGIKATILLYLITTVSTTYRDHVLRTFLIILVKSLRSRCRGCGVILNRPKRWSFCQLAVCLQCLWWSTEGVMNELFRWTSVTVKQAINCQLCL